MTASGDVSDYTSSVKSAIVANFASVAGVAQSRVTLTVEAASVRLQITITSSSKAAAQAAQNNLGPSIGSMEAAAALLPAGFSVESTPAIAVVQASTLGDTSDASVPTGQGAVQAEGGSTALVVGIAMGVVVLIVVVLGALTLRSKGGSSRKDKMPAWKNINAKKNIDAKENIDAKPTKTHDIDAKSTSTTTHLFIDPQGSPRPSASSSGSNRPSAPSQLPVIDELSSSKSADERSSPPMYPSAMDERTHTQTKETIASLFRDEDRTNDDMMSA